MHILIIPSWYPKTPVDIAGSFFREQALVLNKSVCENSVILDMGAGEGAMSQRLFDAGYKVIALDMDKEHFKAEGPEFNQINFNDVD